MIAASFLLGGGVAILLCAELMVGHDGIRSLSDVWNALTAGPGSELRHEQLLVYIRLRCALTATGVGACLGLSGALLQGLFRNGLAAPSLIGVTAGAGLGSNFATLVLAGYGLGVTGILGGFAPYLNSVFAFVGALSVTMSIVALAAGAGGGRLSAANLLLVGIAINACVAGTAAALQALIKDDYEVARAVFEWTFGRLDDRLWLHAWIATAGLVPAVLATPFVATELDLMAGGEDDASTLGVPVARVRRLALWTAAWSAACAFSAAGQIAFIGLMVPHLVRRLVGPSHRRVLWLAPLGGALLLLTADLGMRLALEGRRPLPPGVATSLLGGPFLAFLLLRGRRRGEAAW